MGGVVIKEAAAAEGGALANLGGTVEMTDSTLSAGTAERGGDVFNAGGPLAISSSKLEGGEAEEGGGLFAEQAVGLGTVTLVKSTVTKNHAGTGGGAYLAHGTLEVEDSSITFNSAEGEGKGGGVFNEAGTLTLTGATLKSNLPEDCEGEGC